MSWSGSSHFDSTRSQDTARITTAFLEPDDKRQAARALYHQGGIDGAAKRAGKIMISGEATADDYLFMGLIHHALRNPCAGMWGGVGGILPPPSTRLGAYSQWRVETNHTDQDLLTETV
jgi:hypothetical protein